MLGSILRGFFLLGILCWYSQSVWRMIDGYFRDQFQKYLHEEFVKNPKIRADLKAYSGHVGKAENPIAERTESELMEKAGIDIAETFRESMPDGILFGEDNGRAAIDKTAPAGEPWSPGSEDKAASPAGGIADAPSSTAEKISVPHTVEPSSEDTQRKQNHRIKWQPKKLEEAIEKTKKKRSKVKLLTLTEADFESARRSKDYDFSKFEVEEEDDDDFEREDSDEKEGILISELPYKPRLDLGGLQRIFEDEFCPLSPDDEATCGDTTKWP